MPEPVRADPAGGEEARIAAFLAAAGWGAATRRPLAGDASHRRYERLAAPSGTSAVLMIAPEERGESVGPYLALTRHLRALGLSAPEVYAEDAAAGLLLLEDLGDALFARQVATDPSGEATLYTAAVDLLAELGRHPAPAGLAPYDAAAMARLAALAHEWYAPGTPPERREAFRAAIEPHLAALPGADSALALRDYHAENLIWLPGRKGIARVGLIDFQDGQPCHPAYDLVSLLDDARRDVPPELRARLMARFAAATGAEPEALGQAAALLSVQRNLRILGVFARLAVRDGKPRYLAFLPRVWAHVQTNLAHPALHGLRASILADLPPPDAAHTEMLRSRCAPIPQP